MTDPTGTPARRLGDPYTAGIDAGWQQAADALRVATRADLDGVVRMLRERDVYTGTHVVRGVLDLLAEAMEAAAPTDEEVAAANARIIQRPQPAPAATVSDSPTDTVSGRPAVTCDPAVQFGHPHVKGVTVEAIGGVVWAGEPVETVADEYGLTRPEVLVACWYLATHGAWRRRWGQWAEQVHTDLAAGRYDIPNPPDLRGEG